MSMTWSSRPSRWITITGILELFLAGVFVIIGFGMEVARSGMWLTAGILGLTGVGLLIWGRKATAVFQEAERLRDVGVDAQGHITGLKQTGVYLNEQPQVVIDMQVATAGAQPYPIQVKEYVPMMLLGALSNGNPLPLKVDPADPTNVVIQWDRALQPGGGAGVIVGKDVDATPELIAQGAAQGMMPSAEEMESKRLRLRQIGKEGTAVVQSVQDGGMSVGRFKIMIVDLVVTIDGVAKDVPASGAAVPTDQLDKVAPGMVVPIRYDAANPDDMTLLWEDARPVV